MTAGIHRHALTMGVVVLAGLVGAAAVVVPVLVVTVAAVGAAVYMATRLASRVAAELSLVVVALLGTSLVLLRLPMLFPEQPGLRLVPLAPLVAVMVFSGPRTRAVDRTVLGAAIGFVLVIVMTLLRGAASGAYGDWKSGLVKCAEYSVVAGFAYFAFTRGPREREADRLRALALAPGAYAVVNLVLYAAGFVNPKADAATAAGAPAQLLGLIGVEMARVVLPLADGVNNFGVVCAMGLAAAVVLVFRDSPTRTAAAVSGVACAACLLIGDSRLALFGGLGVGALLAVFPRLKGLSGLALVAPLAPVALIAVLGLVAQSQVGASFTSQGRDLATGSSRVEIWGGVWQHLRQGQVHDLIGYGAGGQIVSGVSESYASVFSTEADPLIFSTHNGFLQQIIDSGYIGLLVLVGFMVVTVGRLASGGGALRAALLAGMAAVLIGGITEAAPTYYSSEALAMVIMISMAAVPLVMTPAEANVERPPARALC